MALTFNLIAPILSHGQTEGVSNPVGALEIVIKGNDGAGEKFNYLGFPFHHPPSFEGAISSRGPSSITVPGTPWTANGFAGTHYVEIRSGPATGYVTAVTANTKNTLSTADDLQELLWGDEKLAIIPYTTIADVFGAANTAGLKGGALSDASTDVLFIPRPGDPDYGIYYFKDDDSPGGTGWRSDADPAADASDTIIHPGYGLIVKRTSGHDLKIVIVGHVKMNRAVRLIAQDDNLVTSSFPVNATPDSLFGTPPALAGGSWSGGYTDEILVPDGSGGFTIYYYRDAAKFGGVGWRSTTDVFTDQANTVILRPGESIVVNRKSDPLNLTEDRPF